MTTAREERETALVPGGELLAVSPQVHISATTSFSELSGVVSAMAALGLSATLTLRGEPDDVASAINVLTGTKRVDSAVISLRGDKPAGG